MLPVQKILIIKLIIILTLGVHCLFADWVTTDFNDFNNKIIKESEIQNIKVKYDFLQVSSEIINQNIQYYKKQLFFDDKEQKMTVNIFDFKHPVKMLVTFMSPSQEQIDEYINNGGYFYKITGKYKKVTIKKGKKREITCKNCHGQGWIRKFAMNGADEQKTCPVCNGAKKVYDGREKDQTKTVLDQLVINVYSTKSIFDSVEHQNRFLSFLEIVNGQTSQSRQASEGKQDSNAGRNSQSRQKSEDVLDENYFSDNEQHQQNKKEEKIQADLSTTKKELTIKLEKPEDERKAEEDRKSVGLDRKSAESERKSAELERKRVELLNKAKSGKHIDLYNYAMFLLYSSEYDDFDERSKATKEGIKYMMAAASKGNPNAHYELGVFLKYGLGDIIQPDKDKAMKAFSIAASLGHEKAEVELNYLAREKFIENRYGNLIHELAYEIVTTPEIRDNENAKLVTITKYLLKMRVENAEQTAKFIVGCIKYQMKQKELGAQIKNCEFGIKDALNHCAIFY